jgi:hypothetical protein
MTVNGNSTSICEEEKALPHKFVACAFVVNNASPTTAGCQKNFR